VLSNNYFVYNDTIYKQIYGCAIGSPVSPVVANLCMEEIEETAIKATPVSPKFLKRYVDDSFRIILFYFFIIVLRSNIYTKNIYTKNIYKHKHLKLRLQTLLI